MMSNPTLAITNMPKLAREEKMVARLSMVTMVGGGILRGGEGEEAKVESSGSREGLWDLWVVF